MLYDILTLLWCLPALVLIYDELRKWWLRRQANKISADVGVRLQQLRLMEEAMKAGKPIPGYENEPP